MLLHWQDISSSFTMYRKSVPPQSTGCITSQLPAAGGLNVNEIVLIQVEDCLQNANCHVPTATKQTGRSEC